MNPNSFLALGQFYSYIVMEILILNRMTIDGLNVVNWGLTEEQINIGLEYLTLTGVFSKEKYIGFTQ